MAGKGKSPYPKAIVFVCAGLILCWSGAVIAQVRPMPSQERKAYEALSPFEFRNVLGHAAAKACSDLQKAGKECRVLDAGRGNPNFLNTTVREAFSELNSFATELARKGGPGRDLGIRPEKKGIAQKLRVYLAERPMVRGTGFLARAINYAEKRVGLDPDDLVFELADAALGDYYPTPPRILPHAEKIIRAYISLIHFAGSELPRGTFDLFATEGGTAAMTYVFQSLKENMLLKSGDGIAIITPIFSPCPEMPLLNDYRLVPVLVRGDEDRGWQVPDSEIEKLKDRSIKALFMVNPMNPWSVGMSADSVRKLAELIRRTRNDLIVISDTAYSPFVNEFHDLLGTVPENTISVHSYSKYFGATGWCLGIIALHENNVIDRAIAALPKKQKAVLGKRYGLDSTSPETIKFIDRMLMDSRAVSLAHTGGLSTPQQAIMTLFSLFELMDTDQVYKKSIQAILRKRIQNLYGQLGTEVTEGPGRADYYTLIDLGRMAGALYGKDFSGDLNRRFSPLDFLLYLAKEKAVVLLPGKGFEGPDWAVRVSLANLDDDDYIAIGRHIREAVEVFHKSFDGGKVQVPERTTP